MRRVARREVLHELSSVDHAIYEAIARVPTPTLDRLMRQLSQAANRSVIWLAIAAGLAAFGGGAGRRAAVRGTAAIGATSALVNIGIKSLHDRPRPDRASLEVPIGRQVPMPASRSFPSGHSASGFAFAVAAGNELPWLGLPLRFLAAAVAYSRVHTGVHYPGDAVAGSIVGASAGQAVTALFDRAARPGLASAAENVTHRSPQ
jgi:membrane-associated phospholipid phosphatase